MRARPAGPAQSSVLHNSARRGPTKEAHRRALNQPDGLLRSERADQRKRAEAGDPQVPTPRGTHQGTPYRDRSGGAEGGLEFGVERPRRRPVIALGNSTPATVLGPKSASAADARQPWMARGRVGGLRALHLDPGRAGWSRRHGSGRSALRAACPPGEGTTARPRRVR
jgi:hypothetical protein